MASPVDQTPQFCGKTYEAKFASLIDNIYRITLPPKNSPLLLGDLTDRIMLPPKSLQPLLGGRTITMIRGNYEAPLKLDK
jgi:hypothetical protein